MASSSSSHSAGKEPEWLQPPPEDTHPSGRSSRTSSISIANSYGQQSDDDSKSTRKWDDPPEKEPEYFPEHPETVMLLVQKNKFTTINGFAVEKLAFSRSNAHLICLIPVVSNSCTQINRGPNSQVLIFDVAASRWCIMRPGPSNGIHTFSLTLSPSSHPSLLATSHRVASDTLTNSPILGPPRLEIFDLFSSKRLLKADFAVQGPMAFTPDGSSLFCISSRDLTKIILLDIRNKDQPVIGGVLAVHEAEVTHLHATPDGTGLVSVSKGGMMRVTSIASGRMVRKVEVDLEGVVRAPKGASTVVVSTDGGAVVSVWGRRVYVWKLKGEELRWWSLDDGEKERWPLGVSPDGKLVVCRTEDGIDVLEAETGRFRANFGLDEKGALPMAAAFSTNGRWLAFGDWQGKVTVLEVITVDGSC